MKERPILFSGPMVRAILDGRKSMTRRVITPQPEMEMDGEILPDGTGGYGWGPVLPPWPKWPYQIGDRLWVRETWCPYPEEGTGRIWYRAIDEESHNRWKENTKLSCHFYKWRPSIHMPRWASRITLEITSVRVERLQEITEIDAISEGTQRTDAEGMRSWPWLGADHPIKGTPKVFPFAKQAFESIWDSIKGKTHPWESNPWVFVIEFKRVEADHD